MLPASSCADAAPSVILHDPAREADGSCDKFFKLRPGDALAEMKPSFDCRRCGAHYVPSADQWIFYELCDPCFVEFDTQKMRGRFSGRRSMFEGAPPEVITALHVGGEDEIPMERQPYFESCDDWIAHLATKKAWKVPT